MKIKTIRICSSVAKGASILTGLAAYASVLPPSWLPVAGLVFAVTSLLKDTAISAGDIADDGVKNGSFKG
jgi:hypothetical protein